MKPTKKAFREYLNKVFGYGHWQNGRYRQIKRPYGDYLYHQDLGMFNENYDRWIKDPEEWRKQSGVS